MILLTILVTSIIGFPFSVLVQLVSIMTIMIIFFLIMRKKLKPSLKIFQATIKKVAQNDPSLDDADILTINSISDSTFFNPKKLIKYSNLLLINQNTILEAACSDRDYINKNRKLQDTIINLNHSIVSTENTEALLDEILKTAINTINDSDAGSVMIPDSEGFVKYVSAVGMDLKVLQKTNMRIKDTFVYTMNKGKQLKPVIIRDKIQFNKSSLSQKNNQLIRVSGSNSYPCALNAPIIFNNSIYGVLCLDSRSPDAFDQEDIRMMEYFTSEMAVVINNSRLIKKAIHLSRYDNLTNVHNRHFFEEIAKMAFEEAMRYERQMHIVLFDLDDFKSVNDSHGHESGDRVLSEFSKTMCSSIRGSDIFARYGGDEFIALLRNSDTKNIKKRITDIKDELSKLPLKFDDTEYSIRFSYGISGFPADGTTLEELLRTADKRMYENKRQNKKGDTK